VAAPDRPELPSLPGIAVRIAHDRSDAARAMGGFLNVRRLDLVAIAPDGTMSREFRYDIATRASLDAVIMIAHYALEGTTRVFLRSAVRPPLAVRDIPPPHGGSLWELPAGLIDPGETAREAAARELHEELGFEVSPAEMKDLGPPAFPAPGFIAEMHHFFHVEVDPSRRGVPKEDGSILEQGAMIVELPLAKALDRCRAGEITDSKTELALRRLAERMP
jgi:ADP-ribose pyrophosphatase